MPGALLLDGEERLVAVWALDVVAGEIAGISSIVNPDKLAHLGPVADTRRLIRIAVSQRSTDPESGQGPAGAL
jgi:RNA polymerase sigma-70 factor (ECF subfamily)